MTVFFSGGYTALPQKLHAQKQHAQKQEREHDNEDEGIDNPDCGDEGDGMFGKEGVEGVKKCALGGDGGGAVCGHFVGCELVL